MGRKRGGGQPRDEAQSSESSHNTPYTSPREVRQGCSERCSSVDAAFVGHLQRAQYAATL